MSEVFKCPFCGREGFKRKSDLMLHVNRCKKNPNRIIKIVSDETRNKLSEASKRVWENPELRQKLSEATKKAMNDPEVKQKQIEALKISQNRPEVKQKISESLKKAYENPELRQKLSDILNRPEVRQKEYETKKHNNSFTSSKIEKQLKEYFISNNINFKTQYKSKEYPFMCDFYFPDKDLYVEIQGTWTHGGKPFDDNDLDCIEQLELWKSKNKPFYLNAIDTWTNRDVKKRNYAKEHGLNWVEIFSDDFETCITEILKLL